MVPEPVRRFAAVAVGGALGTGLRYAIERGWPASLHDPAWATLLVNVAGAFLLGLAVTWLAVRRPADRLLRPLVATGFCGGLTTFSSVTLELVQRGRHGHVGSAALELLATMGLGGAAALAGILLAGRLGASDQELDGLPDPDDTGSLGEAP